MKIAINELEHLRQEVKNCHQIIKDLQKKRQWVGLTDEDYKGISSGDQVVAMWAERILKEKNNG